MRATARMVKKQYSVGLDQQKQQVCTMYLTFSLPSLHDYHMKKLKLINNSQRKNQRHGYTFFMSSSLNQNSPKPKYQCNSELICIRDFEAIQKTHLEFLNLIIRSCSFFKQYMIDVQCTLVPHCGSTLIFCRSFKLIVAHYLSLYKLIVPHSLLQ